MRLLLVFCLAEFALRTYLTNDYLTARDERRASHRRRHHRCGQRWGRMRSSNSATFEPDFASCRLCREYYFLQWAQADLVKTSRSPSPSDGKVYLSQTMRYFRWASPVSAVVRSIRTFDGRFLTAWAEAARQRTLSHRCNGCRYLVGAFSVWLRAATSDPVTDMRQARRNGRAGPGCQFSNSDVGGVVIGAKNSPAMTHF